MHVTTISLSLACLFALKTVASAIPREFDPKNFKSSHIITRDIAVIGGGAGGVYSAISLKDQGKSVIVVEKKDRIGGHAETYIDPASGTPIDMGVIIFHNNTIVRDYMSRFNIPLGLGVSFFEHLVYHDFRTGKEVRVSYNDSDGVAIGAAMAAFSKARDQWPQLFDGTFLPDPVPAELYQPFSAFVKKYGLEAAVPTLYNYNPGVGTAYVNIPTVEVFRYWGSDMASFNFVSTARHNTSELYSHAQAELTAASSLLLKSEVIRSFRSDRGVTLIVKTPEGSKLIIAKKLVIAIPPKADILSPFDLDSQEKSVFGKWINGGYWVGIVKNSGFPDDTSITNAVAEGPYNFPPLPQTYSFAPTGVPGLQLTTFGTEQTTTSIPMTEAQVKAGITKAIKTLQKLNPGKFNVTGEPEFVDFRDHSPYTLQVKGEDIKAGFYDKLYELQGKRSTYYTGAAWVSEDSSRIWRYSKEQMLPKLLASF
jgi:hypothetical protein